MNADFLFFCHSKGKASNGKIELPIAIAALVLKNIPEEIKMEVQQDYVETLPDIVNVTDLSL